MEETHIEIIWKDIKGYEGMYQVSNTGEIRSLDRYILRSIDSIPRFQNGKIFSKITNADGYYQIKLSKNNIPTPFRVHRLVAEAFIPNLNNLPEVNHIDCNRKNNNVNNLEWTSHLDNVKHSSNQGKYKHFGTDNPNYGNHILSEIYRNNPELAIEKLSRPASQNGRAVKVKLFDNKYNYINTFDWVGACAQYLINNNFTNAKIDSMRYPIRKAIKNKSQYLNHYFERA